MTGKERMLSAYRREPADRPPISPEIWSATVLEYTGLPFHKCYGPFAEEDYTALWLETQKAFGFDAWLLSDLDKPDEGNNYDVRAESRFINPETIETKRVIKTVRGDLEWITRTTNIYDGWGYANPVRDFSRDIGAYAAYTLDDPSDYKDDKIRKDIRTVGDDGLLSAYAGELFVSWLAGGRTGDIAQTLLDLSDYPEVIAGLFNDYMGYMRKKVRRLAEIEGVENVLVINGYSDAGVIGPGLYRKWEVPLLREITSEAHAHGLTVHLHQHGKCARVLGMIADTGVDLVDSLERPTANGDITDIEETARIYGPRIALKGNMDPINALKNGARTDIESQADEIARAALTAPGFIIGTGDSVVKGTPFKNLEIYRDRVLKMIDCFHYNNERT